VKVCRVGQGRLCGRASTELAEVRPTFPAQTWWAGASWSHPTSHNRARRFSGSRVSRVLTSLIENGTVAARSGMFDRCIPTSSNDPAAYSAVSARRDLEEHEPTLARGRPRTGRYP